jgi:ParB family transcriptional regulator, chromosome partitioning protein
MERKPDPLKRKVLGRGLSALLPERPERGHEFLNVPVDRILPNPFQPRRAFPDGGLDDLIASIREKGVLQPILVRTAPQGYELVAGERRLRAAQAAGLEAIPAIVRNVSDRESLEAAIVENVQRADLNAVELAGGLSRLIQEFSLTQEEVAGRIGKDRATVANTLRLLKLPPEIKEAVADGRIAPGHARALLSAPPGRILEFFYIILQRSMSVRETESLCRKGEGGGKRPLRQDAGRDPHWRDLEERLSRRGGTRVRIRGTAKKGRFEIKYFSEGEFDRLCEILFHDRQLTNNK